MPPKRKKSDSNNIINEPPFIETPEELIEQPVVEPKKRQRPTIIVEDAPPINSIADLIKLGKSNKFYKNIDIIVIWKLLPYLEEIDNMIGMTSLKESVFYQIIYYIQNMHSRNMNDEYLHTIIMGPPGSGKTTVSKILGNIYKELGILSNSGSFKIAYRDDFIAGYLGQTAIKTRKLLQSCIGGVLFIDEVYALGPGESEKDSFSKEALDTLTGFLSEHKNDFCCIAAGYEDDIKKCFFAVNQGLESRFPWVHRIDVYSTEQLYQMFLNILNSINWQTNVDKNNIIIIINNNKDIFKNSGRDINNYIGKCKMAHARRVLCLDNQHKFILTLEDLQNGIKLTNETKIKKTEDNSAIFSMYT
uniref:AAA+ ATPase domain-containing protein n=1 Tax=viral metagenome TaxID=1070528 RepID=A0A6C0CZW1_9ZZZZ